MRDHLNRPVPYINIWSAEMPETTWLMRYDPDVREIAVQAPPDLQGEGEPDFTKQEPRRQRRCIIRRLCQVCARPVQSIDGGGVLVLGSLSVSAVDIVELGQQSVVSEPWLCEPCARFAMQVCPGLICRSRDEDLLLVRPIRTTTIVSRAWIEGPLDKESKRVQPVLWAKLVVHSATEIDRVSGSALSGAPSDVP